MVGLAGHGTVVLAAGCAKGIYYIVCSVRSNREDSDFLEAECAALARSVDLIGQKKNWASCIVSQIH